jgi:hypothetical protein
MCVCVCGCVCLRNVHSEPSWTDVFVLTPPSPLHMRDTAPQKGLFRPRGAQGEGCRGSLRTEDRPGILQVGRRQAARPCLDGPARLLMPRPLLSCRPPSFAHLLLPHACPVL